MYQDTFGSACDRLSQQVDAVQFGRLCWSRHEGPMLTKLADLARAAIEQREDLEFTEEGSTAETVGLVLKVHGQRIFRIDLGVESGLAVVSAAEIARSAYKVQAGAPVSAEFEAVDPAWMTQALEELFGRLQPS